MTTSRGPADFLTAALKIRSQIQEDIVWSKAKHTIRFGGQYNYMQMNKAYGAYDQAVEQIGSSLAALALSDQFSLCDNHGHAD